MDVRGHEREIEDVAAFHGVVPGFGGRFGGHVVTVDGVGTKTLLLAEKGDWHTIGWDAAAAVLNDLTCTGAHPVAMTDYVGMAEYSTHALDGILGGVVAACDLFRCPLVAGETAIMPDVYRPGAVEVVCTVTGSGQLTDVRPATGDHVVALRSRGPHCNGFTLIRRAAEKDPEGWARHEDVALGASLIYTRVPVELAKRATHVTSGGVDRAINRLLIDAVMLWSGSDEEVDTPSWARWVGNVLDVRPRAHLNCGFGMILLVDTHRVAEFFGCLGPTYDPQTIGFVE